MNPRLLFASFTFASIVALACSSSSSGNGTSGSNGQTCSTGGSSSSQTNADCSSCTQSNCSSEISALQSACSALLNCESGCACSDTTCLGKCVGMLDSGCQSALSTESTCQKNKCAAQCNSGAGGSSSAGGSSAAGGSGSGMVTASCYVDASKTCQQYTTSAAVLPTLNGVCTQQMGTIGTGCPSANLLGCCKTSTSEVCIYMGSQVTADSEMMSCMQSMGTWSTSPLRVRGFSSNSTFACST